MCRSNGNQEPASRTKPHSLPLLGLLFAVLITASCSEVPSSAGPLTEEPEFARSQAPSARPDVPAVEMDLPPQPRPWDSDDQELTKAIEEAGGRATIGLKETASLKVSSTGIRAAISGASIDAGINMLKARGVEIVEDLSLMGAVYVRVDPLRAPQIRNHPRVDYVEPRLPVYSAGYSGSPGEPDKAPQGGQSVEWGIRLIKANEVWGVTTGTGAKVLVIDGQLDRNHEDLPLVPTGNCGGQGGCGVGEAHGTHVSGIVVARNNSLGVVGVAPGLDDDDVYHWRWNDSTSIEAGILQGITWRVGVINMSIEGPYHIGIANAVSQAWNNDIVLVGAGGNLRTGAGGGGFRVWPAAYPQVIGVSGIQPDGDFAVRGDGDNHDLCADVFGPMGSNWGTHIEIAAPFWARSTLPNDGYGTLCGTSMATPHVTGTIALMRAKNPTLSNAQIVQILLQNTFEAGVPGWDPFYGWGILVAKWAVDATPYPPAPLNASIVGPLEVSPFAFCTWQAIVTGGTAPYSYSWSGALSGSGGSVSGSISEDSWLYLTVTDAGQNQDSDQLFITVDEEVEECEE